MAEETKGVKELFDVEKKGMSVSEYYANFIALSKFALEVVSIEVLKAQRLEQDLTLDIQMKLGGETFSSLDDVYGRAANIYGLMSRNNKIYKYKDISRYEIRQYIETMDALRCLHS